MPKDTIELPALRRAAFVRSESFDADERTAEVVWTTGQSRIIRSLFGSFEEELGLDAGEVRLDALNAGAPFLADHRQRLDSVLGVIEQGSARIEDGQGIARVRFSSRADISSIISDIREGIITNISVGYRVHRFQITERDGEPDLWRAVDWEPLEVSAVAVGADTGAKFRSGEDAGAIYPATLIRAERATDTARRAGLQQEADMPDHDSQAANEETRAADTEARAAQSAGDPAPGAARPEARQEAAPDLDAIRAEERRRAAEIMALAERHSMPEGFARQHIDSGAGIEQVRAAILDHLADQDAPAGRRHEPSPAAAQGDNVREQGYSDAMTAALVHRFDPSRELPTDAREFRGMTLIDMARDALGRRGISTRGLSKMEVADQAFAMRSVGYHSTSDFPAILANTANKTLRDAYARTERSFTAWARQVSLSDFKPVTRTQLSGAPSLEAVKPSGEFTYGQMTEGAESYQLATYGRIIAVTRQTLVNDDLDAFTRIPSAFGQSAADLESDLVYAILTGSYTMADGTALFDASRGNVAASGGVISETTLSSAFRGFAAQRGLEGRPINIMPSFVLVPPGVRSVEARKQVAATTPSNTGDVNTFAGRLTVIEEPRLIPAAGEDPWFLTAAPGRIDTLEFAYLDGQQGVYTETRMGFNVDGVEIKARHDFVAAPIDPKGFWKNAGAAPA